MNKSNALHYQLPVKNCWSHTFLSPKANFEQSPQFAEGKFHNTIPKVASRSKWQILQWVAFRKADTWNIDRTQLFEQHIAQIHEVPKALIDVDTTQWKVWFICHATVLIQIGEYNFLTDPVWAEFAGPKKNTGPQRVCPAGIALENLPHIHGVLLSHNHYDHMDLATLEWLHKRFAMPIYTGLGNGYYLPKKMNVIELDWWQSITFRDFEITYTPAQHGSGRGLGDQNKSLWGSFCLKLGQQYVYFAGDTGYSPHFKEIYAKFGAPRVALLPIGAYEPRELMQYMHMNPQDALKAHMDLQAHRSVAIHYRTFQLTDEARDEPERVLEQAMKSSSKLMNPFYCIGEGKKLTV